MGFCDDYYTSTDDDVDSFIKWTATYCDASTSAHVGILILVLGAIAVMMVILGTTADMYFVPALQMIAYLWKLRPDVAGVTLLAFGNGAPDIITAVTGVDAGNFGIVIGNLLGGNAFIQMLVMGAVLRAAGQNDPIVSEKGYIAVDPKAFVRDMSSYIFFILLIMVFSFTGHLHLWHACVLLVLYFTYVAVVIYSGSGETKIYDSHLKKRAISVASVKRKNQRQHSIASINSSYHDIAQAYESILAKEDQKTRQTSTNTQSTFGSHATHHTMASQFGSSSVVTAATTDSNALAFLMEQTGDQLENNGDTLPGVGLPEDLECCRGTNDAEDNDVDNSTIISSLLEKGNAKDAMPAATFVGSEDDGNAILNAIYDALTWVLFVLEWPFCLARALSIPTTDLGWGPTKRYFTALSFPGGVLCVLVTFFGTDFDASIYVIASSVGVVFGAFFLLTSSDGSDEERATKHTLINDDNKDEDNKESQLSKVNLTAQINPSSPMRAGQMWLYPLIGLAFMSSVGWLNAIAGEAVAASLVIAGASGLSSSVVGLTLLAWGNSIGDYVADVAVCNAGSPYTAVSSCIGSPMLSAIIGICLSVVVNLTGQGKIGEGVPCNLDTNSYVSYAFLLIAQVMTMFVTVTNNYKIPVSYYKYLWVLYVLFLVVVVTIEVSGNNSA